MTNQVLAGAELSTAPEDPHQVAKSQNYALKANRYLATLSVLDDLVKEPSEIPFHTLNLTT